MLDQLDKRAVSLVAGAVGQDLARRDHDKRFLADQKAEEARSFATARAKLNARWQQEALIEVAAKRSRASARSSLDTPRFWDIEQELENAIPENIRAAILQSFRPAPVAEKTIAETPKPAAVVPAQIIEPPAEAPAVLEETAPLEFDFLIARDDLGRVKHIDAQEIGGARQWRFTVQRDELGKIASMKARAGNGEEK
jgi:hypothetical protein